MTARGWLAFARSMLNPTRYMPDYRADLLARIEAIDATLRDLSGGAA